MALNHGSTKINHTGKYDNYFSYISKIHCQFMTFPTLAVIDKVLPIPFTPYLDLLVIATNWLKPVK